MADWALAVTQPNTERTVSRELARIDIDHRIIWQRRTRVLRGRLVEALVPAFPRYVMVPVEQAWVALDRASRIVGLVEFGGEVAKISAHDLHDLAGRVDGNDVLEPLAVPEPFTRGDRVYINGIGLLGGQQAIYDGLGGGENMLRLLVDWMGRMVPIEVDRRDVSSYGPKSARRMRRNRRNRYRPRRHVIGTIPLLGGSRLQATVG